MADMTGEIGERIPGYTNPYFGLFRHPATRSAARAVRDIPLGHTIFTEDAVTAVLADAQRGKRCDACYKVSSRLTQCPECKEVWYCDSQCMMRLREAHHLRICPSLQLLLKGLGNQVSGNPEAIALARKDILLLLQLVAKLFSTKDSQDLIPRIPTDPPMYPIDFRNPASVFTHLLPGNGEPRFPIPYPFFPLVSDPPANGQRYRDKILLYLASRFRNNNFGCWTSDMEPLADAVFPLASRLFNHLCRPNCVVAYEIIENRGIVMELRAVRPIVKGEDITIPYVDVAICLGARRLLLKAKYNFDCECAKCQAEEKAEVYISEFANLHSRQEQDEACKSLMKHVLPSMREDRLELSGAEKPAVPPLPKSHGIEELPTDVLPVFNSTFLPETAQKFSEQAHARELDSAIHNGRLLLALYLVHYTTYWPMIGLHCFELGKTIWNKYITTQPPAPVNRSRAQLFQAMCHAEWALRILLVSVGRKSDGRSKRPLTQEVVDFRDIVLAEWRLLDM